MDAAAILLVEDDPSDAELLIRSLEDNHVANPITVARDGVEALDILRGVEAEPAAVPVLILLDVWMPRVDGVAVLRFAKASPSLQQVPVIMMLSAMDELAALDGEAARPDAVLVKPAEFGPIFYLATHCGLLRSTVRVSAPKAGLGVMLSVSTRHGMIGHAPLLDRRRVGL
jgi:two-component system response regulator